ncbi:MAG: ABC transporter permease [Oscillospiraceae bacterium]
MIFTGYLIIYNIFQISVAGDIRFYGLLKTIGTTPRQLKRIIRQQALLLCLIGIPAGLLLGYGIGAVLVPVVLRSTQLDAGITTISTSPVIFVGSVLFALLTVLLSCSKPGKMAARVSPVEATKYTDAMQTKKKQRSTRGAKLHQMAFANLGRNKKDGAGGGVSGTVGDAVQCTVCLCGRLQHGEVCILHDLRRFYRQHARLFPLQPGG